MKMRKKIKKAFQAFQNFFVPSRIKDHCRDQKMIGESQLSMLRSLNRRQTRQIMERDQAARERMVRAGAAMTQLQTPEYPVVLITDSNYVGPTLVAVSSLIRHRADTTRYKIFVIGTDLTDADRAKFRTLAGTVTLLEKEPFVPDWLKSHRHVSPAALWKFQLPLLFESFDRILYLDSDIIVRDDLSELFRTDLEGRYAAAVSDPIAMLRDHYESRRVHRKRYFNSGVMLLNLKKMREDDMTNVLLEEKKRDNRNDFMDQDVLNVAFNDLTVSLSPRYNWMEGNIRKNGIRTSDLADLYGISQGQMRFLAFNPVIEHLSNYNKPWNSDVACRMERWDEEQIAMELWLQDTAAMSQQRSEDDRIAEQWLQDAPCAGNVEQWLRNAPGRTSDEP